jgi:hypothetical protein
MEFLTLVKYSTYSSSSINGFDALAAAFSVLIGMFIGVIIVTLALVILIYAAYWSIMKKAGKEGIDGIIPIHNEVCLLEICGIPKWWWLLNLVPGIGVLIFAIILAIYVAKSFGKTGGYAVGLIFLPFVFYPMLAWGSARYVGKSYGVEPQPQYQPQYQPQQPQYQAPQQQYQAPQQPQNPGNNVPPQQ